MFKPKYVKHGELLVKGVQKFIRYKTDVMKPGREEEVNAKLNELKLALRAREPEKCKELSEEVTKLCEKSVASYQSSPFRENVEVLFVTIVFALGIRAYFLQPFKIPTGSMMPTLYGITTESMDENEEKPGLLQQGWELISSGRNYVELRSPVTGRLVGYRPVELRLVTLTELEFETENGERVTKKVWAPPRQVSELWRRSDGTVGEWGGRRFSNEPAIPNEPVTEGQLLIKGIIDTGDQVLVNKISYHFRRPDRGEVFVFNTRGIHDLTVGPNGEKKLSTHYIKRLSGVPGDSFEVKPPELWINGKVSEEPGNLAVMTRTEEPFDQGYTDAGYWHKATLGPHEYLALGDNSANSFDSRGWGPVPEKDIVGPAWAVYWPFTSKRGSRWGRIR
ncbi:MAG: signal peptidase I [Verrucomicrobiae bacterium]|nr:signal peptidase I [Verrucomicrobiae bacterium]